MQIKIHFQNLERVEVYIKCKLIYMFAKRCVWSADLSEEDFQVGHLPYLKIYVILKTDCKVSFSAPKKL